MAIFNRNKNKVQAPKNEGLGDFLNEYASSDGTNMYGYIYETTNLINGKKYIGQKKSNVFLEEKYLGSGKILALAINKYGKENFRVRLIEECDSKKQLNEREIYWIDNLFKTYSKEFIYNIGKGGEGGFTLAHLSEEERKIFNKRRTNKNIGKKRTDEQKKHISEALSNSKKVKESQSKLIWVTNGIKDTKINYKELDSYIKLGWIRGRKFSNSANRKFSEEARNNMSKAHKGKPSPNKGKHLTEETKKKISEANINRFKDINERKKLSNSLKGNIPWNKDKCHTEETKKKISKSKQNSIPWNKGLTKDMYERRLNG